MPTNNRRIATYIPKEIDEKFQVFKQEKEVGDSQALILILGEYFGVSQQMAYSSDSPLAKQIEELSSLVGELRSELAAKAEQEQIDKLRSELDTKAEKEQISELKSELDKLNGELASLASKFIDKPPKQLDIGVEIAKSQENSTAEDVANGVDILTTAQLAQRLGCKVGDITTKKFNTKDRVDVFRKWTENKDPQGCEWEFRKGSKLFYRVSYK